MISNAELNKFAALDLEPIKVKLMHKESGEGWSVERANAVEVEYRRFLYLAKLHPDEQMAPLLDVDIFWHYHILDTMKYAADCEQIFGYFLHHFPYVGLSGDDEVGHQEVGARMKELYAETFCQIEIDQDATQGAATRFSTNGKTAWCLVARAPNQDDTQGMTTWFLTTGKTAWCLVARAANQKETQGATAWFSTNGQTAWCLQAPRQHLRSRNPGVSPRTASFQLNRPTLAKAA